MHRGRMLKLNYSYYNEKKEENQRAESEVIT